MSHSGRSPPRRILGARPGSQVRRIWMDLPLPTIEVTDRARARLLEALAQEANARFIRIDVGRG